MIRSINSFSIDMNFLFNPNRESEKVDLYAVVKAISDQKIHHNSIKSSHIWLGGSKQLIRIFGQIAQLEV